MLSVAAGLWVAVAILAMLPPAHTLAGVFYDDGIYLALGRSLAQGEGYRLLYLPGAPAAVHYPFGYPVFLAVLWKLWPEFPENLFLLRSMNAVLMGLFAGLAVAYAAPRLPVRRGITALVVALACTAIPVVAVATVLFAEPLFLVITAAACWCADSAGLWQRDEPGHRGAVLMAAGAGCLAGAAALTRSIGIAVIAGVVLAFWQLRQRRLAVAAAAPALLLQVPWWLWTRAHAGETDPLTAANYGTYGDFLRQSGVSWFSSGTLADLARPLAGIALPPLPGPLRLVLGLLVLGVLLLGMARLTVHAPALGWMLAGYAVIVMLWPYGPDRFLWGALPWLAVAFVAGVHRLAAWRPARWRTVAAGLAAATVAIGFGIYQVRVGPGGATATQRGISDTMSGLLPWVRQSTDTSAVLATESEALVWLYTGRRAVPSFLWRVQGRGSESFGPDSLHAYLERSGATHLVLAGQGAEAAPTIDALIGRRPGYLEVIRSWPSGMLAFRIRRGA